MQPRKGGRAGKCGRFFHAQRRPDIGLIPLEPPQPVLEQILFRFLDFCSRMKGDYHYRYYVTIRDRVERNCESPAAVTTFLQERFPGFEPPKRYRTMPFYIGGVRIRVQKVRHYEKRG